MNAEAAYRLPTQLLDDPSTNNKWQMTRSIKFEAKQMKLSFCSLRFLEGSGFSGS